MSQAIAPCSRCLAPLEADDIRCPICCLATPDTQSNSSRGPAAQVLRCGDCGAAVSFTIANQAPKCSFCSAVMHVERPEDPLEVPDQFLPFAITPEQAAWSVSAWIKSRRGFFTPKELPKRASISHLVPIWWVGWVADAEALVTWAADTNLGSRRAAWAPCSGVRSLSFSSLLIPATRGLSFDEASYLTPSYQTTSAAPTPHGPPQTMIEQFDVQRSAARGMIVDQIHIAAANVLRKNEIPGTRHRNVKVSALLNSLKTRRLALPAYILAYRYEAQIYRVVISGQNPNYVWGRTPKTYKRLFLGLLYSFITLVVIAFCIIFLMMLVSVI